MSSYFALYIRPLSPIYLEKLFSALLSKLVDYKQIQPSDPDVVKKIAYFWRSVVRENKYYFSECNFNNDHLDEFYMRYLKWSIHYKTLTSVIQLVLVLSHSQTAAERGFSLNNKLLVWNSKSESLIARQCVKDFLIVNTRNVCITKKLMGNVKSSSQRYKAYLEEQRKFKTWAI